MNAWWSLELPPVASAVGWTLLHFVWQAALVALATAMTLSVMRRRSAEARYAVCGIALAAMIALPIATFLSLDDARPMSLSAASFSLSMAELGSGGWQDTLTRAAPLVSVAWLLGVWVMQIRLVFQFMGVWRLRREGLTALGGEARRTIDQLTHRLGLRHAVAAFASTRAGVPMVIGWLRPVVLVPTSALTGLSPAELRAVLAHELAHVRRHDALVNLVQTVFESLFFFHPAVWWLSHRLRVEREFCCDDVAVATCGDTLTYARALASLDALREVGAPALAANGGSLMHRIARVLGVRAEPARRLGGWIAPSLAVLALSAAVSAMTFAQHAHDDETHRVDLDLASIDLVKVVGNVDAEEGHALAQLREIGLDDDVLFAVFVGTEEKPDVLEAVYKAAHHAAALREMKEGLHAAHVEIREGLENGTLSREEADLRLAELEARHKIAMETHGPAMHGLQGEQEGLHDRLDRLPPSRHAADGEGLPEPVTLRQRLTDSEASRLHEAHQAMEEVEVRLAKIETHWGDLDAAVEAGELSEQDAKERYIKLEHEAGALREKHHEIARLLHDSHVAARTDTLPEDSLKERIVRLRDAADVKKLAAVRSVSTLESLQLAAERIEAAQATGDIAVHHAAKALELIHKHLQHLNQVR